MSNRIDFSGDDLASRVPLLSEFRDTLMSVIDPLVDVAACRWADGAPPDDDITAQAKKGVSGMITTYLYPGYDVLGDSVGAQGTKMDLVRRIGDNIEDGNTETADWGGGGGRHG
jgi:hypothetical protein